MGDDGNAYPFFTPGLLNGMKELTLEADAVSYTHLSLTQDWR